VQAGAAIDTVAHGGFCALDLAQAHGHAGMANMLENAHAQGGADASHAPSSAMAAAMSHGIGQGGMAAESDIGSIRELDLSPDEECAALAHLSSLYPGGDLAELAEAASFAASESAADAASSPVEYGYGWGGEESDAEGEEGMALELNGICLGADIQAYPG